MKFQTFYSKYKELILGLIIGTIVSFTDFIIDFFANNENRISWNKYISAHQTLSLTFLEHFLFIFIGLFIGYLWWKTGNQYREQNRLNQVIEEKRWFNELLLDVMTHDISNYNQIALGNLYLIKESNQMNDEIGDFLVGIRRAVIHSDMLTANVKILNQLQSDQLEFEAIYISLMIEDAIKEVKKIYPEISLKFEVDKDPNEEPINANPILKNVFVNIFRNSVLYRKQEQKQVIVKVEIKQAVNGLHVCISDYGMGIPNEIKKSVFSRFVRGEHQIPGSGLGLSISKRIIESRNGKIWVENLPDFPTDYSAGSAFRIFLPTSQKEDVR